MNVLNQREVVLFVKRLQLVPAKKFFYITSPSRKLVAAFICSQKNGRKISQNVLVPIFGTPPSRG